MNIATGKYYDDARIGGGKIRALTVRTLRFSGQKMTFATSFGSSHENHLILLFLLLLLCFASGSLDVFIDPRCIRTDLS